MKHFLLANTRLSLDAAFLQHQRAHPVDLDLLKEAVESLSCPPNGVWKGSVDLHRTIGHQTRIPAPSIDIETPALFCQRIGRPGPSRVLLHEPLPTSHLAMVGVWSGDNKRNFHLITAYPGTAAEREPNGFSDIDGASVQFWCRHALVYQKDTYRTKPFVSTWKTVIEEDWKRDTQNIPSSLKPFHWPHQPMATLPSTPTWQR